MTARIKDRKSFLLDSLFFMIFGLLSIILNNLAFSPLMDAHNAGNFGILEGICLACMFYFLYRPLTLLIRLIL